MTPDRKLKASREGSKGRIYRTSKTANSLPTRGAGGRTIAHPICSDFCITNSRLESNKEEEEGSGFRVEGAAFECAHPICVETDHTVQRLHVSAIKREIHTHIHHPRPKHRTLF